MYRRILQNSKGFVAFLLVFASILPLRSAEAPPVANDAPNIISWSGIRMITLGTRYMTEMPEIASSWLTKNKEGLIQGNDTQAEQVKKIAQSISDGMRNVGKMLVLVGAAKEYKDYFEYASNPKNPFNNPDKYSPEIIRAKQGARLKYLQTVLGFLRAKLAKQGAKAEWLAKLFDENTNELTRQSLKSGVGKIGEVFELLNVYGIGIQISSDLPIGSLVSLMLSRWPGFEKAASRFSVEDSIGILFYMQKKSKDYPDVSKDPLYQGLPADHPIFELLRRETYGFAAKTYEQSGAQVEGVSYAHKSAKKTAIEVELTVRLTFLASTEVLKNFDVMNMNYVTLGEISARNNLANAIPDNARKLVMKAQDKIQNAFDQSKYLELVGQDVDISAAHVFGSVNEDTGQAIEVPNMLLRISLGNYALAASKDRVGANELINIKGSLGSMTIDAN